MREGDGEAWYAYWAFHRLGWRPGDFAALPFYEKAMVVAMIQLKLEEEAR